MRTITQHIIHCSDSMHGDVETIRQWHLARGWSDIGYHFVILPDGTLECGRPIAQIGAHCRGYNRKSIGTCLIGKHTFTPAQFTTLKVLHAVLQAVWGEVQAHGHCEFNPQKSCPNFDVRHVL